MATIYYQIGDATAPPPGGNRIICHICNDIGAWGKGFVLAVSRKWPEPEVAFRQWYQQRHTGDFALGALQLVQVRPDLWVANMIAQHGIHPKAGVPPIRYDAVETALARLAQLARERSATVHMPRIGCGLAGGTWDRIEPIIQRTLSAADVDVHVYDRG